MPAVLPHSAGDLALAPVLVAIERNLERLRTCDDPSFALALALDVEDDPHATAGTRALRVLRAALAGVNLHGLAVEPTEDLGGIAVTHGEYRVSLMLGGRLTAYVTHGVREQPATL